MTFNLADLYEVVAAGVPDRDALVAGGERRTFAELDARANRVANHLLANGVAPGEHVGIHALNCAEWIETMLGCFKARAVPINVNYRYVADELRYLYDNADLTALFVAPEFAEVGRAVAPACLRHVVVLGDGYEQALAGASDTRPPVERSGDDPYVIYTGGTTGMPKGTIWRSEDLFFGALGGGNFYGPPVGSPQELAEKAAAGAGLTMMACAPMMHGGGQWVSLICLFGGGKLVLYTGRHFDPGEVWQTADREQVQSLAIVGDAMGRPLAEWLRNAGDARPALSSLIGIGSGGAILSSAVRKQIAAELPALYISDSFGASETGANGPVRELTVDARTTVLDDDNRPVVPGSGTVGRLARCGPIPLGYYKDEAKTAATFVEVDGVRWVIPGDAATVDANGKITVLGRGSVSINSGGEKIFPEEVEAALKSHPDVFDAVVVGIPDERFVERVAAIVQPRAGASPTLAELAAHCRSHIAGYKVPRSLVLLDEIVRTPVGKPDYRWAKETALAGTA